MFKELKEINSRPAPFQFYTADELWTNEYTAKQMLEYHLNESIDASSRNLGFIELSVAWIASQLNRFWSPEDYYCFVNTFKYEKEKVILDKYTVIEESRQRIVYNWLQCYSKDSLTNEFEENGFKVDALYSDIAGKAFASESTEIAIVAKKA